MAKTDGEPGELGSKQNLLHRPIGNDCLDDRELEDLGNVLRILLSL